MKTLEFATDILVMRGLSEVETHPDRTIQRTPAEPKFWFGNRVIFHDAPVDADHAIQQFHDDFPDAAHICLSWDLPGLDLGRVEQVFAGRGLTIEQADTLALAGDIQEKPVPEGLVLRAFDGLSDWRQSEEIGFAVMMDEGYPEAGTREFLADRSATRRQQIGEGQGQWFGAFEGDLLVGDMGIFHDDQLIRYQKVQTRDSHRGRGICSALLCHALAWARGRAPDATPVIVAEADSAAGRLYRRAGFELAETTISAYRGPQE